MHNSYIGHEQQLYGVEEVRLVGGKGDGMRLLQIKNGGGLELTLSLDRCADISRLSLHGVNFGYFAPCGYVAPTYYDPNGAGFLKSFTAGFLTTCGLFNVGSPCTDAGEALPLHGTVSHTPAEAVSYTVEDGEIRVRAVMRTASLFSHKLVLEREYRIPLFENKLTLTDTVKNIGCKPAPLQMLYHFNVGYPLLDETTVLSIPSVKVEARNAHAEADIANWMRMEPPQSDYEERCYYHTLQGLAHISVKNPHLKKGFEMIYDTAELPCFTEWKMMGDGDYVLGVEPGNALPDGRDVMRKKGLLQELAPDDLRMQTVSFLFTEED